MLPVNKGSLTRDTWQSHLHAPACQLSQPVFTSTAVCVHPRRMSRVHISTRVGMRSKRERLQNCSQHRGCLEVTSGYLNRKNRNPNLTKQGDQPPGTVRDVTVTVFCAYVWERNTLSQFILSSRLLSDYINYNMKVWPKTEFAVKLVIVPTILINWYLLSNASLSALTDPISI